jgi:hydrogenase/urease accessory protein HupE
VSLKEQIGRRFRLYNGDRAGVLDMVMPMADADDRDSTSTLGGAHVIVMLKAVFDLPPTKLRVETDIFGTAASERQLTVKATRGSEAEAAVFTPSRVDHRFFRTPIHVLRDYITLGVAHIVSGTDHLLFLLTVIVAAAGWRYWFGVLTIFTVAHSITPTMSLFQLVKVPTAVVEPLIAASIVVMALLNLRQRSASLSQRLAIVFACGLLHGLGFASSIANMGLHGAYRAASVIGFNVGIEVGQTVFLLLVLALGVVLRALFRKFTHAKWSAGGITHVGTRLSYNSVTNLFAAAVGTYWLMERLGA